MAKAPTEPIRIGEPGLFETTERPDAWLCELTLQEPATEPVRTCRRCGLLRGSITTASRTDRERRRGLRRRLLGCRRFWVGFRRGGPGRCAAAPACESIQHRAAADHHRALCQSVGLDWTGTACGQAGSDSRSSGTDHGAAGADAIELGGNRAWLRPNVQAGRGPAEFTCRCRGTPFPSLVPGQGSRSRRIWLAQWPTLTRLQTSLSGLQSKSQDRFAARLAGRRCLDALNLHFSRLSNNPRPKIISISSVSHRDDGSR